MKIYYLLFVIANIGSLLLTVYLLINYKEDPLIGIGFAICAFTGLWSMIKWNGRKEN